MKGEHAAGAAFLPRPEPGVPPRPRVPRASRWGLDNGLRVVSVARDGLPQVALKLVLPNGSVADPPELRGLAALTAALMPEGTEAHTAEALNLRIDALGASLSVHTSHDFVQLEMLLLAETLAEGLELLGEVVARPVFPEAELERHRAEMLDALEARLDEPANVADDHAAVAVFGEAHAYGHLSSGTAEGIGRIGRDDVVAHYRGAVRPGGAVLILAGAFDETYVREALPRALRGWEGIAAPPQRAPVPAEPAGRRIDVGWADASQAEIRVAGLGLARSSVDWVAASVANYLLGGSTITGRLGQNLREEKGWTYGVRSAFSSGVQPAGWTVETAVERDVADRAVAEIVGEIRRLIEEGVTAEELRRAKEAIILSLPRAFETASRVVGRLATVEAYGLGERYWDEFPSRVESVTAEEVARVARAHFDPERLVQVVVG